MHRTQYLVAGGSDEVKVLAVNATVMEPTSEVAAQAEDIILYAVQIKNTQTCSYDNIHHKN